MAWTSINGTLEDSEFYTVSYDNRNTAATADDLIRGPPRTTAPVSGTRLPFGTPRQAAMAPLCWLTPSATHAISRRNYFMGRVIGGGGVNRPAGTVAGTGGKVLNAANAGTKAETFPFTPAFQINQGDIGSGAGTARVILGGNQTLYVSSDQVQLHLDRRHNCK